MRLKLFRSTGHASVFGPGETRIATHPGWVMRATSLWLALACNAPPGLLPWAWLRSVPVKRLSVARPLRVHLIALAHRTGRHMFM
ncbi:MAG: hypothetical protein AB7P37_17040 [Ramlibacter sp.]